MPLFLWFWCFFSLEKAHWSYPTYFFTFGSSFKATSASYCQNDLELVCCILVLEVKTSLFCQVFSFWSSVAALWIWKKRKTGRKRTVFDQVSKFKQLQIPNRADVRQSRMYDFEKKQKNQRSDFPFKTVRNGGIVYFCAIHSFYNDHPLEYRKA